MTALREAGTNSGMKIQRFLPVLVFLPVLALSPACQSSGHDKADSTASSMDSLRKAVGAMKERINASAASLAAVVENRSVDPKPHFQKYTKDVESVVDGLSRIESGLKSMKSQGQAYFAEWEKQAATIEDPDLKKSAEDRRARLVKAVDGVSTAVDAARAEIQPFVTKIRDVRTYLSNDLTPAGIESVEDKSKRITNDAESIGEKLDDVAEAIDDGAPEFKTAKPPPPPKKT